MNNNEQFRPNIDKSMELGERKLLLWAFEDGIETEEFDEWFGDSVLVDSENKPLVFYHGTREQFDHFDETRVKETGFHFGSAKAANQKAKGGRVYPVVISMRNPIRLVDQESFSLDTVRAQLDVELSREFCDKDDVVCQRKLSDELYEQRSDADMRSYLVSKGFDGIVYANEYENISIGGFGVDSVVVFNMNQVRSAIDGSYLHQTG